MDAIKAEYAAIAKAKALKTLARCFKRFQNAESILALRTLKDNWLDGLMMARVRVVKSKAERQYQSSAMGMFCRCWKRIKYDACGDLFVAMQHKFYKEKWKKAGAKRGSVELHLRKQQLNHTALGKIGAVLIQWTLATKRLLVMNWRVNMTENNAKEQVMIIHTTMSDQLMDAELQAADFKQEKELLEERVRELEPLESFFQEQANLHQQ